MKVKFMVTAIWLPGLCWAATCRPARRTLFAYLD